METKPKIIIEKKTDLLLKPSEHLEVPTVTKADILYTMMASYTLQYVLNHGTQNLSVLWSGVQCWS